MPADGRWDLAGRLKGLKTHTGVSHCFFYRIAICALPGAQDSRDGLTSRRVTV